MSAIVSEFVKEQKRYTKNELKSIFKFSTNEVEKFIINLKAFGVLKSVKRKSKQQELTDLLNADIEFVDEENNNDNYFYVFSYVGVITIGSRIVKCYPKYLNEEANPLIEMKKIIKVINKYGYREQVIELYDSDHHLESFNILGVVLFLLNDFHENGVYNNTEDIIEVNGVGEIVWEKTINESFSLISNNRPYYMELYTQKTRDDEFDFYKRLHECVLTQCSVLLETTGLLNLFDLTTINLSEESIKEFGDLEYILYKLESELNIQYNSRKRVLLKTIYAYLANRPSLSDNYGISMIGTNNFNLVWEDVCARVFNNKLRTPLGKLELPVPLKGNYNPNDKLIDIINKPKWIGNSDDGNTFVKTAKDTLIPDLITISQKEGNYQFIILDAKYYNIQLDELSLKGQPGVEDVTKQYLYQLAFRNFISDHAINEVKNCFLFPVCSSNIIEKGKVRMEILSSLDLVDVQLRKLPADIMYDYYLSGSTMDVTELKL